MNIKIKNIILKISSIVDHYEENLKFYFLIHYNENNRPKIYNNRFMNKRIIIHHFLLRTNTIIINK